MRLLYYIKTTLKSMVSSGAITLVYFIGFPIILAGFMGFVQNTVHDAPLKLKSLNIQIVDEDNSEMSNNLVELLKSDDMKDIVQVVDSKPEAEIIIPEGYEKDLLSLNKGKVIINKKEEGYTAITNTIKIILDKYHQSLYVSLSGGSPEELNKITGMSIIEEEIVDIPKTANTFETTVASMLGFVISMLIFSNIQSGYTDISMNLDKRVNSTPLTKLQYLLYESAALLVYTFIIIAGYVMFFRIAGLGFEGNIISLIILVLTASILVVGTVKLIATLFGAKYGRILGGLVFILPIIGGEIFMGKGNTVALFTPTHYLNNAFTLYNLNGNLEGAGKWILIVLAVSAVSFLIAMIKESLVSRRKLWA